MAGISGFSLSPILTVYSVPFVVCLLPFLGAAPRGQKRRSWQSVRITAFMAGKVQLLAMQPNHPIPGEEHSGSVGFLISPQFPLPSAPIEVPLCLGLRHISKNQVVYRVPTSHCNCCTTELLLGRASSFHRDDKHSAPLVGRQPPESKILQPVYGLLVLLYQQYRVPNLHCFRVLVGK